MRYRASTLLSLAFLSFSCSTGSTAQHIAAQPSASPPVEQVAAPAVSVQPKKETSLEVCRKHLASTLQSLEALKSTPQGSALHSELAKELGCHGQESGTWALTVEDLRSYKEEIDVEAFKGQIRITRFLPGTGKVSADIEGATELGQNEGTGFAWGIYSMTTPSALYFDFDGDGSDELILTVQMTGHESESSSLVRVFTFKNGRIGEIEIPSGQTAMDLRDIDGDGRPDLILESPFTTSVPCTLSGELHGPQLVARSMSDGTFSITDPVALAYLKRGCPSKPTLKRVPSTDVEGYGKLLVQAACAVFWGAKPLEVQRQIRAPAKGGCRYEDNDVEEWVNTKVPVTLQ